MWRDGTSHLLFVPIECMEKLAAIIPRPAVNLVSYHGVLAPHARWRPHVVSYGRPAPDVNAREREPSPRTAGTPGAWTWAALMRRVFDLDVLACPRCGGRLRVIAAVQDPLAVQAILTHQARAARPRPTCPRRTPVARSSVRLSRLPLTRAGAPQARSPTPPPAS
jgi:hypothetical protein